MRIDGSHTSDLIAVHQDFFLEFDDVDAWQQRTDIHGRRARQVRAAVFKGNLVICLGQSFSIESAPAQDEAQTKRKTELLKTVEEMDKKLQAIEFKLVSPSEVNSDDKYYVEAYKVYLNLIWLNAEVGTGGGDVAGGADFPPTDTELELLQTIEKDLTGAVDEYKKIVAEDLPAFNRTLSENNVAAIVGASAAARLTEDGK